MLAELVILAAASPYGSPIDLGYGVREERRPAYAAPGPSYEPARTPAYAAPLPPATRERGDAYERTFMDPPPVKPMSEWFK